MKWIKTDDLQFVLPMSDSKFRVIDIVQTRFGIFIVNDMTVDLENYTRQELEEIVAPYGYSGINEIGGNQTIAKCIVEELTIMEGWHLNSIEEVEEYLRGVFLVER